MVDIILTADISIMNDFHLKEDIAFPFYGSGEMFPKWLFKILIGKPEHTKGVVKYAPYALRKIEATLIDQGLNVLTVSPDHLKDYLPNAKILGIHTVDPLGLGSTPYFYETIKTSEHYSITYLQRLLEQHCIDMAKSHGLKIIVGGEGAWQLKKNPGSNISEIVDSIVIGEGELIVPQLCRNIMYNKPVQKYVSSNEIGNPKIDEISTIHNASNFGFIEIGRGCNRCCKFCEVTKTNLRWYPYEKIEKELIVNNDHGLNMGIIHAEDVFLYGQKNYIPDDKKMVKLFKLLYNFYDKFIITHFSLAAVQANRSLFKNLMEMVLEHQNYLIGESGIETASTRLMKNTMSNKVLPFKLDEWEIIIKESLGLMHDNNFIPYCSIIIGLPDENSDDVIKTLNLIDDLKDVRFIILPSSFTPLGVYTELDSKKLSIDDLDPIRKELVIKCLTHNSRWVYNISKIVLDKEILYRFLFKLWYKQSYLKDMIKKRHKIINVEKNEINN